MDPINSGLVDVNKAGIIFAERILALNKQDTVEKNEKYPDSKRLLNYPIVDNSPINFAGCTSLKQLAIKCTTQLKRQHEEAKARGENHQAQFLSASVSTDKELIDLRIFSKDFNGLTEPKLPDGSDNPDFKAEGWLSCGITRRERVQFRGGGTVSYGTSGKTVKEVEQTVAKELITTAPAPVAKPAV